MQSIDRILKFTKSNQNIKTENEVLKEMVKIEARAKTLFGS